VDFAVISEFVERHLLRGGVGVLQADIDVVADTAAGSAFVAPVVRDAECAASLNSAWSSPSHRSQGRTPVSAIWDASMAMPSRRFPLLVTSLAEQVARVGRLPLVHALGVSGPPPTAEAASAVRARDLLARTSVRDGVSFEGPVLLVDDTVRTRWTVTVASALLADAGASQVMPLAVHLLP
jgi:hypothetical protein